MSAGKVNRAAQKVRGTDGAECNHAQPHAVLGSTPALEIGPGISAGSGYYEAQMGRVAGCIDVGD